MRGRGMVPMGGSPLFCRPFLTTRQGGVEDRPNFYDLRDNLPVATRVLFIERVGRFNDKTVDRPRANRNRETDCCLAQYTRGTLSTHVSDVYQRFREICLSLSET